MKRESVKRVYSVICEVRVERFDHLVLTVREIEVACSFYQGVLGMKIVTFAGGRKALRFGRQKINLHQYGHEFSPHAAQPTPGSADFYFVVDAPLADVVIHLEACGAPIVEGPVARTGATGPIQSVYVRDPDENLIEIATYMHG